MAESTNRWSRGGGGGSIPRIESGEKKSRPVGSSHTPAPPKLQPQSPGQSKSYDHSGEWDRSDSVEWNAAGARSSDNSSWAIDGIYVAGAPGGCAHGE